MIFCRVAVRHFIEQVFVIVISIPSFRDCYCFQVFVIVIVSMFLWLLLLFSFMIIITVVFLLPISIDHFDVFTVLEMKSAIGEPVSSIALLSLSISNILINNLNVNAIIILIMKIILKDGFQPMVVHHTRWGSSAPVLYHPPFDCP